MKPLALSLFSLLLALLALAGSVYIYRSIHAQLLQVEQFQAGQQ